MATLQQYRRAVAKLAGPYESGTASTSSVTQLVCTTFPFKSDTNSDTLFRDKFLFRPSAAASADKDRYISTYTPSSGFLVPDLVWTNAPTSETFEVHTLFSGTTWNEMVNKALERLFVVVEFTFTVDSTLTKRHSLASTASWLTEPAWVYQVGALASGESRDRVDPFKRRYTGRVHKDSSIVYIEGPSWNTTDTVYVKAIKPAYNHCSASGGSYGSQTGLSAETDIAVPDEDWVAQAVLLELLDRTDYLDATTVARKDAMDMRQKAAARFSALSRRFFVPPDRYFVPRVWIGLPR